MTALPDPIARWLAARGWRLHPHQRALLAAAEAGESALLVAPTGGGKTLAGFLPALAALAAAPRAGLHTLYISPLKALTQDVQRNLTGPIAEMGLDIATETRTGDTPQNRRRRQRRCPPQILLTTPESLALMLSYPDAGEVFGDLHQVILDELHALAGSKRGDLLALGLARLAALAPAARRVGLSATVRDPDALADWLASGLEAGATAVRHVEAHPGPPPEITILDTTARLPWSGHMALHALPEVYARLRAAGTSLVFVNTRAQAELVFQGLWELNADALPIALHHGSLDVQQRRRVEAAMARGALKAVVATSSLDLGIDWGAVDLVIQIGAPKGVSRLLQRIGRANHRLDTPSRALLVPANRFEVLECHAAVAAARNGRLDGTEAHPGGLDVLCQHILATACAGPFEAEALYREVTRAAPYRALTRRDFDDALAFVDHGGYALKGYRRFRRLQTDGAGRYWLTGPGEARRYRLNAGTIVEAPRLKVRLAGGRVLGEVEEYFVQGLEPGDTFLFAGMLLRFEGLRALEVRASRAPAATAPKVPAYVGGRLPLSTHLAEGVRALLADPVAWDDLPVPVARWLRLQAARSQVPARDTLLVETFPRGGKVYLVAYPFEGRNAHQTLGMLVTRRLERFGLGPLGFVASDYALAVWMLRTPGDDQVARLFEPDLLGDDLEAWMAESAMLRRTFRNVGLVAGLLDRQMPGAQAAGRQLTVSADLVYDVLRKYEPDHVLLRATVQEAATGLTDVGRLGALLARVAGRIERRRLDRVSPLAVPVLLEIGREPVDGAALDELLADGAEDLIAEAAAGSEGASEPDIF